MSERNIVLRGTSLEETRKILREGPLTHSAALCDAGTSARGIICGQLAGVMGTGGSEKRSD